MEKKKETRFQAKSRVQFKDQPRTMSPTRASIQTQWQGSTPSLARFKARLQTPSRTRSLAPASIQAHWLAASQWLTLFQTLSQAQPLTKSQSLTQSLVPKQAPTQTQLLAQSQAPSLTLTQAPSHFQTPAPTRAQKLRPPSSKFSSRLAPLGLIIVIFFWLFLPACRRNSRVTVIKLAHGLAPTHPVHQAMEFLAARVLEESGGRLRIDIYPSEQLGSERECLELLQIGSLGMTKVSCSVLEGFVPEMSILSLPYLFRDEDHRFRVLEGDVGRELLLAGEKYWLRGLCFYDAGTRSFYTKSRPILRPEDLVGLKIRTQESPTSMKMVQALGGSPTPIAWGELYSALQQGVVDGAENNPPSFYLSRHYQVCPYYSLDEHTGVPDILLISTHVWRSLTPEFQQILQAAADESSRYQRRLWREATRKALEEVKKAGVKIFYPDKKAFAARTAALYEEYKIRPHLYQLIQRIKASE